MKQKKLADSQVDHEQIDRTGFKFQDTHGKFQVLASKIYGTSSNIVGFR